MRYSVRLCNFSGSAAYLTRKQKKDPVQVLQALADDPRVSTWDMEKLHKVIYALVEQGMLKDETKKAVFPWHRFTITKAGKRMLKEGSGR